MPTVNARSLAVVVMTLGLIANNGCSGQDVPRMVDTLGSAIDQTGVLYEPDFRELAPIAVVARVGQNQKIGQSRPAFRYPLVLLELHAVRCRLEIQLKGHPIGEEFTFYYFAQDPNSPQPNPIYNKLFAAKAGGRYLFFFSEENGALRAIGDVGEYSIPVQSGQHPGYKAPSELGRAAADILLSRGEGANDEAFAHNILLDAPLLDKWGSRLYNSQLLRRLTFQAEPVRMAACRELAENYNSQYDCLYRLRDDTNESTQIREEADALLVKQARRDELILATVLDLTFPIIGQPDSRRRIRGGARITPSFSKRSGS